MLNKLALVSLRIWTKPTNILETLRTLIFFHEGSSVQIESLPIFEILLIKIEPWELISYFYNKFFFLRGSLCLPGWQSHWAFILVSVLENS